MAMFISVYERSPRPVKAVVRALKRSMLDKFLYIRVFWPHLHLRPRILETRLHRQAGEKFLGYRERFGSRRCFVIGNGPSLNRLDLTKLKDEITIGSNGLFLNHSEMGFYPTFYTVTNHLIAEQFGEEISRISESIKIFPSFLRRYFKHCIGEVIFFNADGVLHCSEDVTQWVSWAHTVTFFNLQIAYSLGCPEVYLIGVDNDYVQPPEGKEGDVIVQKGNDRNHFSSHYFPEGFKWHRACTDNMARTYCLARDVFTRGGRLVANATRGGKLDVFPRVNYEDLFETDRCGARR